MEDREIVRNINAAVVSGLSGVTAACTMIVEMMVDRRVVSSEEAQRRFELLASHFRGPGGNDLGQRVIQQVAATVAATRGRQLSIEPPSLSLSLQTTRPQ